MPARNIERGETLGPNPKGRKLRKGHAAAVEKIDREPINSSLGRVHDRIVSESERVAKIRCPLNEDCEILAAALTSYDSYPSEVVFECPREDEDCEDVTLYAAKDADRQISQANRLAAEAIMDLGPSQ